MRVLRFVVNWLAVLTTPVWVVPYLITVMVQDWKRYIWVREMFTGKRWFWE